MAFSELTWLHGPSGGQFQRVNRIASPAEHQSLISQQAATAPLIELPKGLVTEEFSLADVATSLTDSKLYRIIAGPAGVTTAQIPIRPLFRGSVVGLALQATAAKTAGTATFQAFVKGSAGVSLTWATGETHAETTVPIGTYPFSVGDDIDVRVTTDGTFAPTTTDAEVIVYLAQSSAGSET